MDNIKDGVFISILFVFMPIINNAQTNIVLNSSFELIEDSNGTKVISLNAAKYWQELHTADIFLREVSNEDKYGNIVRIAPHNNEIMIGSLKRKLRKNEKIVFQFDLYSKKRDKSNKNFSLLFCDYNCDSIIPIAISLKLIKGWQTIAVEIFSNNSTNTFCFISSSSNTDQNIFFIDNMEILVEDTLYQNSTLGR